MLGAPLSPRPIIAGATRANVRRAHQIRAGRMKGGPNGRGNIESGTTLGIPRPNLFPQARRDVKKVIVAEGVTAGMDAGTKDRFHPGSA